MNFPKDWQLPEYDLMEFFPGENKYAICVFTINEGERFQMQILEMKPLAHKYDIIIADGDSTDGSTDKNFLIANNISALLVKKGAGKLSAQMRMAFAYALAKGYEGIIVVDGNHKDDLSAVDNFSEALNKGVDHIQGSRFIPGGTGVNTPWLRLLAIRIIHAPIISLAAGYRYTDTTNGFRAYSSRFLLDPHVAPFRDIFSTYELHYYLAIRAPRLGYKVTEVPVKRSYPKQGKVPTKITPVKGNLSILKILILVTLGRYNP
jgi:dolichol-phosphate mannosyltransferase